MKVDFKDYALILCGDLLTSQCNTVHTDFWVNIRVLILTVSCAAAIRWNLQIYCVSHKYMLLTLWPAILTAKVGWWQLPQTKWWQNWFSVLTNTASTSQYTGRGQYCSTKQSQKKSRPITDSTFSFTNHVNNIHKVHTIRWGISNKSYVKTRLLQQQSFFVCLFYV